MKLTRVLLLFVLMLTITACGLFDGGDDDEGTGSGDATSEATESESPQGDATQEVVLTATPSMPQTTTNEAGTFTVGYPEDWTSRNRTGTVLFSNITPVPDILPDQLAEGQFYAALDVIPFSVSGNSGSGAATILQQAATLSGGEFLQLDEPEELAIGDLDGAQATGTYTVGALRLGVLYVVVVQNDSYGLFTLYAPEGEAAQYAEDALQVMRTFAYTPVAAPAGEPDTEATAEATP